MDSFLIDSQVRPLKGSLPLKMLNFPGKLSDVSFYFVLNLLHH